MSARHPWLLVDVSSLCHRLFHVLVPHVGHPGRPNPGKGVADFTIKTGVVFGCLKQVHELQDAFCTTKVAFCFDVGEPKRCRVFPGYKATRRQHRLGLQERDELDQQMEFLRTRYLPAIGYRNIFGLDGYEADDLIGVLAKANGEAVVVSSDQDFYQLLTPTVRQWLPHHRRLMTYQRFRERYTIAPEQWGEVKSLTGCSTDEIPGIDGVGEITALRYLLHTLNPKTKAHQRIESATGTWLRARNRRLVTLPFEGTPHLELYENEVLNPAGWKRVCRYLGMTAERTLPPGLR